MKNIIVHGGGVRPPSVWANHLLPVIIAAMCIFASCENDNYDEPDAGLQGTLTDEITGKPLVTEQPNGFQIRNKEISWTGTNIVPDNPEMYARYFW